MTEPSPYQLAILMALQKKKPGEVYSGTVSPKTRMQRRGTWGAYVQKRRALRQRFIIAKRSATKAAS